MSDPVGRAAPLRPGDPHRLGGYELVGRLGEGGMGVVYLARTPDRRLVAVKVIRDVLAGDEEFRRRFRGEVLRARQVPPFCTAEVLDADPNHDPPYLVVEFVDGPSLADVVQDKGPLSAANLHGVAIGVATALTAIHGAGVIHRDLKPRNVLLAPGSPKVIDFGIARALTGSTAHTRTDHMVGTVAYMAPERFDTDSGATVTAAADIFAWGAVVAYAGAGTPPFGTESPPVTAARILTQPPELSALSGPLRYLVEHSLAKHPADRPTARELLDMLLDTGPQPSAPLAVVLARQPALREAAQEARAATEHGPGRHLTAAALPRELAAFSDDTTSLVHPDAPTSRIGRPPAPPVPAGPARRRWRWAVPAALVTVLATLAGVAYVSGLLPRPDLRPAAGATAQRSSGAPSSGAPVPAVPRPSARVQLRDALSTPHYWEPHALTDGLANCSFDAGLVAERLTRGSFRCQGPKDVLPRDQGVEVNVRLLTVGSCASIWFRFTKNAGYQVRVCHNRVLVGTHKDSDTEIHRTIPLAEPIAVGAPQTRIGVYADGDTVQVWRDGQPLGDPVPLVDDSITNGRVVLGIFTEEEAPWHQPPYRVAFDQVEILALS